MRINQLSPVNLNMMSMDSPYVRTGSAESAAAPQPLTEDSATVSKPALRVSSGESADESEEFNDEMLQQSITQANRSLAAHNRVVERSIHEVTKTVMYTVKDTVTHEVIAEFPPKRIQDMIAKMWELAGLFVDEKA